MREIFKRLKLISDAIKVDDVESVKLQLDRLKSLDLDDDVKRIVENLEDENYDLLDIESYLEKQKHSIVKDDDATEKLKSELKMLEKEFRELAHKKSEYLNTIEEFNTQYSLKLGTIIRKVLSLKRGIPYREVADKERRLKSVKELYLKEKKELEKLKSYITTLELELGRVDEFGDKYDEIYDELQSLKAELLDRERSLSQKRREVKKTKEDMDYDPKYQEYKETQSEYEDFKNEYKEILSEEKYILTPDEKVEIKKLFKRAAKLCHPDIVASEMRDRAQQVIQDLNRAYAKRDLSKVKEILSQLEGTEGLDSTSNSTDDKEILKFKIAEIKAKIKETIIDIKDIQEDETYYTIERLDDWDRYFNEMRDNLQDEYNRLKEELFQSN